MAPLRRIFSILILSALAGPAGFAQETGLPGNATSLSETHGDWIFTCAAPQGAVRCAIIQQQVGDNRQRILAIELAAAERGNTAGGTLILPFGLDLDQGAVLSIDEAEILPPFRFSTCLPAGCLVPLAFNADAVTAMRAGTALKVKVAANESGHEVNFSISLSGFTAALARAAQLTTQ